MFTSITASLITTGISNFDMTAGTDTGTSSSDNITSINTPTFSWDAKAGATSYLIQIDSGSQVEVFTTSYTAPAQADGVHTIKVWPKNAAGTGLVTTTSSFTIDTALPTATGETVSTAYNTALNAIDVLANDSDNSGTALLGTISSQVGGTFTVNAGKINFTPTNGFSGAASCVYQVLDTA